MIVLDKIKKLLDDNKAEYELIEHAPVHTSEEAAKIRGSSLDMGAKALVFYADKKPVLLVIPGDKRADLKKFKKIFGVKDLRMATPDEVFDLTTVKIGAVPPVGKAMDIDSYYDAGFKEKDKIAFNAGMRTVSIIMKAGDLIKIENPKLANIVN